MNIRLLFLKRCNIKPYYTFIKVIDDTEKVFIARPNEKLNLRATNFFREHYLLVSNYNMNEKTILLALAVIK